MATATARKGKFVQVIQEGWYSGGIYRRMGEVLPIAGVNVGLMKRHGYLANVEPEDIPNIRECDFDGCATAMVRTGFDDEDVGERSDGQRSTHPVERLTRKEGAGPRLFVSDDALESHKMQDHGMEGPEGAQLVPGGPPASADPGEPEASGAGQEAANQPELERKRVK